MMIKIESSENYRWFLSFLNDFHNSEWDIRYTSYIIKKEILVHSL